MIKRICAVVAAFVIVNLFSAFYYNPGVQYASGDGATGYRRGAYHYSARLNEGASIVRADRYGFNNDDEPLDAARVSVVVMGTSHFEGYNVCQSETLTSALNSALSDGSPLFAYNIASSSHTVLVNLANLDGVTARFPDAEYIVFEFSGVPASRERLAAAMRGEGGDITTMDSGFLYYAQHLPFFKAAYSQVKKLGGGVGRLFREFLSDPVGYTKRYFTKKAAPAADIAETYDPYPDFIEYLDGFCEENGVRVILVSHPYLVLSADGEAAPDEETLPRAEIAALCEGTRVTFLDMTDVFLADYYENHRLQHGFSNTQVNSGHLNSVGHALIARELAKLLEDAR